jgi:hypothetical protein
MCCADFGRRRLINFHIPLLCFQLVSELDKLIAQSRVQDYHPGSDGKVLDILHPSMCASALPSRPSPCDGTDFFQQSSHTQTLTLLEKHNSSVDPDLRAAALTPRRSCSSSLSTAKCPTLSLTQGATPILSALLVLLPS